MLGANIKTGISIICFVIASLGTVEGQGKHSKLPLRILPKLYVNQQVFGKDSVFSVFNFNNRKIKTVQLPFFCRIEEMMSVQARFPVRIRLGNLDYVNKLEGKGHQ